MGAIANRDRPKATRTKQIRAPLEHAIRLLIEEGRTIADAAQIAGLQDESLRKALKKPHVKEFVTSLRREWSSGQTLRSWVTIAELRDTSPSDKVRLEAAKTFVGAAGELEPEREPPRAGSHLVQIILPQAPGTLRTHPSGVIDLDPEQYAARPQLLGASEPQAEGDDA